MPDLTPADLLAAYYGSEGFPPGEADPNALSLGKVLTAAGRKFSDLVGPPYQGGPDPRSGFMAGLTPPVPQSVVGLGGMVAGAAALPGDVQAGRVAADLSNPEYTRRAFDLASIMIGAPGGAGGVGSGVRSQLGEVPSFTERMDALKDAAFQRAQRGTATGDYGMGTARRTEPAPPKGSMEDASDRLMSSLRDTQRQLQEYKNPPAPPILAPGETDVSFFSGGNKKAGAALAADRAVTEMTPIGEQYVLPGAERASEATMAQRVADAPLKAEVPQKPMDVGLFGDESKQGSLFSGGNKRAGTLLALARGEPESLSMADVLGPQMGVGSPYLRNPNAPLFDYARMGERVPTKQFGLTRTESTDVTPDFAKAGRASNIARVNKIVEQGIKEGGLDWHNMLPLLEEYTGELGSKAGPAAFNTYMDRVGATSPNSNVLQNFRTASYYDNLLRNGLPLPEIKYKASTGNPYIPEGVIPYPYGNTAQGLHVMNLNALAEGGYPLSRPKPPSFAENMKGNYTPVAIDRHNLTLWGIDRESPNLTGYRYLEDLQQQQAAKMGVAPAQYQAAGWLPYAESGAEPALKLFENRIRTTAEQAGLTKEQVLREFIRGKMRLQ